MPVMPNSYTRAEVPTTAAPPIQAAIRDHFYPPHDDWKEMVLFRSWQVWRQALAGLAAS